MIPDELREELEKLSIKEAVEALQNLMVSIAEGGGARNDPSYDILRNRLRSDPRTAPQLPAVVKVNRTGEQFWGYIKKWAHWAERRKEIFDAFSPLLDALDSEAPADKPISDSLQSLDVSEVHDIWTRALARRATDAAGAITSARTLLESTCKHILDELGIEYDDAHDLPKLYKKAANALNLSPAQHDEQVFKQVLGGCASVVEGLSAIRNRLGDAHGKGRKAAKVAPRHAELAVNLAGGMATFLVETWAAKK